ncbi:MAG: RdgB/HAM1 family non-canonical purine NTP pyrophosphatase [Erysipelothrix sp.]|nr:RdgB/HAM1 family non-canonical purine NTP pyrophosphatase [Erysipelothrix sp.]
MKIALASSNKGKIREFKQILEPLGYTLHTAEDLGVDMSKVVEDGKTFTDNAKIKAKYLYDKTGLLSIADDSGLIINALPDILGVYSARFMGEDTDYAIKNKAVLEMLEDKEDRSASFHSIISIVGEDTDLSFEGDIKGNIDRKISGENGFGYDPIFIPESYDISFASLDDAVKNEISHRAIALKKVMVHFNAS